MEFYKLGLENLLIRMELHGISQNGSPKSSISDLIAWNFIKWGLHILPYQMELQGILRNGSPKSFVCSDRILTFGIRSIRSPAKAGLVITKLLTTSPVVSCPEGVGDPPTPPAPRLNSHSLLNHH